MNKQNSRISDFFLDIFFPKFCFNCKKEGIYLCQDCEGLIGVLEYSFCLCQKPERLNKPGKCKKCNFKKLDGLYFALPYQNNLAKQLIHYLKYDPFAKELSKTLSSLIINHLQLIEKKKEDFIDFLVIPIPLAEKRLKWRNFNQSKEIGKNIAEFLEIPLIDGSLIKIKNTKAQIELSEKEREENIKGSFVVKDKEKINGRKILLIDDVYTTGSTMEETAKILKESGAKEVWGMVVARG